MVHSNNPPLWHGPRVVLHRSFTLWFLVDCRLLICAKHTDAQWPKRNTQIDSFDESLHIRTVPFTRSPQLFLARFEFNVEAAQSTSFLWDQFDIFPKPIGKLLNSHPSIAAFEAALTRGRWKEEWGPPPREFRPPGAVLIAATNSTDSIVVDNCWRFLISALSGALCASFEGMDPDHESSAWVRPSDVPWTEPGQQLRFATLPYEPVCTENLTPWLKLLPCGRHRGLTAVMAPITIAESPLVSLTLAVANRQSQGRVELRASLDVVLPLRDSQKGLAAWFDSDTIVPCPAARSSTVMLWSRRSPDPSVLNSAGIEAKAMNGGEGFVLVFPTEHFASLDTSAHLPVDADVAHGPWVVVGAGQSSTRGDGMSVMRDVLSHEGRSERTHGRYLLRFTNAGPKRHIRFMEQLPFFLRPLWHTFRATLQFPGRPHEELTGLDAMRRLELRFVAAAGQRMPTEIFLTVEVPHMGVVSIFLDVAKIFIQLREFSYACEKGFDVGSAAWMELELREEGGSLGQNASQVSVDDFVGSLAPSEPLGTSTPRGKWQLRFTQGLIVLLPMPDFSMPFNVIALSSTAVTFFFGSVFRLTAAGRMPHWVLKKDSDRGTWTALVRKLFLAVAATAIGGAYALSVTEASQLRELQATLPSVVAPAFELLEALRDSLEKVSR